MVTADPEKGTHFEGNLGVWLFQEQNHDIYYAVDDGDVRAYSGPITLNDASHIYAFARATIDGVDYDSATGDFYYYQCGANEELYDGECVPADDGGGLEWGNYPDPQWCETTNPDPDGFPGWYYTEDVGDDEVKCSYHDNGNIMQETLYKDYFSTRGGNTKIGYDKAFREEDGTLERYWLYDDNGNLISSEYVE